MRPGDRPIVTRNDHRGVRPNDFPDGLQGDRRPADAGVDRHHPVGREARHHPNGEAWARSRHHHDGADAAQNHQQRDADADHHHHRGGADVDRHHPVEREAQHRRSGELLPTSDQSDDHPIRPTGDRTGDQTGDHHHWGDHHGDEETNS